MNKSRVLVIWNDEPAGTNHCLKVVSINGSKRETLASELSYNIKQFFMDNYPPRPDFPMEELEGVIEDLVDSVISAGEAWFQEWICFSLNEVYG